MNIVFFGTSAFAAYVLERLIEDGRRIVAVVTRPDRLQGRQLKAVFPPVKEAVLRLSPSTPLLQPEKASTPEFAHVLASLQADLFVVVAYGEIIKQALLDLPSLGCINIHASLLPFFRGAAPMQRALMAGVKETGITVIEMSAQMDAGDVLAIESIPVSKEMVLGELEALLRPLAVKLVIRVIDQFQSRSVVKIPQDHHLATLAPKLTAAEERIDWARSAEQIHNQIRALSPRPGAWCQLHMGSETKRFKITRAKVIEALQQPPGSLMYRGQEGWVVGCGQQALCLEEVQLEGKKVMSADACLRGIRPPFSLS